MQLPLFVIFVFSHHIHSSYERTTTNTGIGLYCRGRNVKSQAASLIQSNSFPVDADLSIRICVLIYVVVSTVYTSRYMFYLLMTVDMHVDF